MKCFRSFLIRSLRYLNGRTLSPFPAEAGHSAAFVAELWDRHQVLFRPEAFPDVAAVRSRLAEIEKEQAEFVNGVTDESLQRMLPLRGTRVSLGHLMQHLANHSTYHRGQVALMMRQVGGKPLATDFHVFLVGLSSVSNS